MLAGNQNKIYARLQDYPNLIPDPRMRTIALLSFLLFRILFLLSLCWVLYLAFPEPFPWFHLHGFEEILQFLLMPLLLSWFLSESVFYKSFYFFNDIAIITTNNNAENINIPNL